MQRMLVLGFARPHCHRQLEVPEGTRPLPGPLTRERQGEVRPVIRWVDLNDLGELPPRAGDLAGHEQSPAQGHADGGLLRFYELGERKDHGGLMRVTALEEAHSSREQLVRRLTLEVSAIQDAVPQISPFVGLLYDPARAGPLELVTSPPYDTISADEQRELLDASPDNIIRIDLREQQPGEREVEDEYRRAASELDRLRRDRILVPTSAPSYYPYEMRFAFRGQHRRLRGLICAVRLEDWGGSIVPHERTMPGPVEDRLRLVRAVRANLSCIHVVCSGPSSALTRLLGESARESPRAAMSDDKGVEHRLWVVEEDGDVALDLAGESLMIADGHHRYTMALQFRDEMRALYGSGPWDDVMVFLVDAATEDPPVLPVHRILLSGSVPLRGERVRDLEEVLTEVNDERLVYGLAAKEDGALVHRVARLQGEPPVVRALHQTVLDELGASLAFTPDAVRAEEAVRCGEASAAFFLPPTTAGRIRSAIDRAQRLPQKSTYFWPKPRTGMVIRPFD